MIKYHAWKKKGVYHSKHIFYHSGVLVMPILSCTVKTSSMMVVFLLKKPTTWVHGYSWSVQIVFQGLKIVSELVQVIIKTSWILVLHHCDVGDHMGGDKMNCLKNRLFGLSRAQCTFGARQVFGTNFDHIKNFFIWQIFQNVCFEL